MVDVIGHCAYAILALGTALLGTWPRIGWTLRLVGSLTWAGLGIALGLSSIWFWEGIFVAVDLWGFRRAYRLR